MIGPSASPISAIDTNEPVDRRRRGQRREGQPAVGERFCRGAKVSARRYYRHLTTTQSRAARDITEWA